MFTIPSIYLNSMQNLDEIILPSVDLAIVLRSGLRFEPEGMKKSDMIPFLPFLPSNASTIFNPDDGGYFYENSENKRILIFNKRIHRYQGLSAYDTVLPVRIAVKAGAKTIFLVNAAGGLHDSQRAGQYLILNRHIIVKPVPSILPDFNSDEIQAADEPYDPELNEILEKIVANVSGESSRGVYAQVLGPAFETWAEVDYLRELGADAVGMSTALEASYAFLKGLKVVALSLLTNIHSSKVDSELTDEAVSANVVLSGRSFGEILNAFIKRL